MLAIASVSETLGDSETDGQTTRFVTTKKYLESIESDLMPWINKVPSKGGKNSLTDEYTRLFGIGKADKK